MTYLRTRGNQIFTNNTVKLITLQTVYFTTKPPSSGRFYFEFTHINGDHYHYVGFAPSNYNVQQGVFFYQQGKKTKIKIFRGYNVSVYYQDTSKAFENYQNLEFDDITSNYTIGIAFDTYARVFSIYSGKQVKRYYVKDNIFNDQKYTPYFGEAYSEDYVFRDEIHVNFGKENFSYGVPYGYLPWGKTEHITCIQKLPLKIRPTIIVFLIYICS